VKVPWAILGCLFVLLAAGRAQADVPKTLDAWVPGSACFQPICAGQGFLARLSEPRQVCSLTASGSSLACESLPIVPPNAPDGEVRVLPGAPSSLSLFLSMLGSMGIWQFGRSAKRVHWGDAQESFVTGGPIQLGPDDPLDPVFDHVAAAPATIQADAPRWGFRHADQQSGCKPQFLLSAEPTRGPPVASF
jgi:hypothetical protein